MAQLKVRSHLYIRWVFLRLLSLCFLGAFLSIAIQILGLYGEHGILPIKQILEVIERRLELNSCINFPSIFWCNASDSCLQTVCWTGVILSLLALYGIFTGPVLAILWFLYLSIVSVGQSFMGFQWDALLLETALLSAWFAPWGFRELHPLRRNEFESQKEVSYLFLFLLRLLCFKLMMFSGICKLASHDSSWRDLSAMTYHYETQPLPTPLAWLTQKLPVSFQKLSTALVFVVELVLPASLITFSRKSRIVAASGFMLLMFIIMLTGNYAFFNWLAIALSFTLLDDEALIAFLPRSVRGAYSPKKRRLRQLAWNSMISLFPALLIGSASVGYLWMMVDRYRNVDISAPFVLQIPVVLSQPLRSFNSYGLFAVMTTLRPEIIVEGSNDGITWIPYEFKYKPGDIKRVPPIVAPLQPRLDWQMWFAALGPAEASPWFSRLISRLLEGSPEVLALLDKNPFPDKAPKQIRATIYDYHFSNAQSLLNSGEWWQREKKNVYYPATSLNDLQETTFEPEL